MLVVTETFVVQLEKSLVLAIAHVAEFHDTTDKFSSLDFASCSTTG